MGKDTTMILCKDCAGYLGEYLTELSYQQREVARGEWVYTLNLDKHSSEAKSKSLFMQAWHKLPGVKDDAAGQWKCEHAQHIRFSMKKSSR